MKTRVHYIDWLRVLAVGLLIPFHSARVFDVWEPFYAKNGVLSPALSTLIAGIGIWHMPLLFLLAGASSYFALRRRNGREYMGERVKRLLVPLLFGTFVIVPPQMWFGAMTNDGYTGSLIEFWPRFFVLRTDRPDYFGSFSPAHLWFVLFLFVLSAAALPFMLRWRAGGENGFASRAAARLGNPARWLAPVPVLLVCEALPDISGKNPFTYLVFFLLGYIVMADPRFIAAVEPRRFAALALALAGIVATVLTWPLIEALPDPSLGRAGHSILLLATAWLAILACLGFGKRHLDRPSPALTYSAEASYPFYILHQTVIVAVAFLIVRLPWGVAPKYAAIMAVSVAVTLGLYELLRRVPAARGVLGMKPLRKATGSVEGAAA